MSDGKNNCTSLSPVNTPLIIHDSADLIEMKDNDDCNGVDKEKEQTQLSQSNDRFVYEKDQLIAISKSKSARQRPSILDCAFNNQDGLWDPQKWVLDKYPNTNYFPHSKGLYNKRDNFESNSSMRKCDPNIEKIQNESKDSNIILSPQRKSFGTGCHVTASKLAESRVRDGFKEETKEEDPNGDIKLKPTFRPRVGTGRVIPREKADGMQKFWGERGFDRYERDYRDGNDFRRNRNKSFNSENNNSPPHGSWKSYNERQISRYSREEDDDEPEWFTSGPTSKNDTIELKGFEENETNEKSENIHGSKDELRKHGDGRGSFFDPEKNNAKESKKEKNDEFDVNAMLGLCLFGNSAQANCEINPLSDVINEQFSHEIPISTDSKSRFKQWFDSKENDKTAVHFMPQANSQDSANKKDEKNIFEILQRAKINVPNLLSHQQLVSIDPSKAKSVAELEANLACPEEKNVQKENRAATLDQLEGSKLAKLLTHPQLQEKHRTAQNYNTNTIEDLFRQQDLSRQTLYSQLNSNQKDNQQFDMSSLDYALKKAQLMNWNPTESTEDFIKFPQENIQDQTLKQHFDHQRITETSKSSPKVKSTYNSLIPPAVIRKMIKEKENSGKSPSISCDPNDFIASQLKPHELKQNAFESSQNKGIPRAIRKSNDFNSKPSSIGFENQRDNQGDFEKITSFQQYQQAHLSQFETSRSPVQMFNPQQQQQLFNRVSSPNSNSFSPRINQFNNFAAAQQHQQQHHQQHQQLQHQQHQQHQQQRQQQQRQQEQQQMLNLLAERQQSRNAIEQSQMQMNPLASMIRSGSLPSHHVPREIAMSHHNQMSPNNFRSDNNSPINFLPNQQRDLYYQNQLRQQQMQQQLQYQQQQTQTQHQQHQVKDLFGNLNSLFGNELFNQNLPKLPSVPVKAFTLDDIEHE